MSQGDDTPRNRTEGRKPQLSHTQTKKHPTKIQHLFKRKILNKTKTTAGLPALDKGHLQEHSSSHHTEEDEE